jgi:dGTPase
VISLKPAQAAWACHANKSQGRVHGEEPSRWRNAFQRDRDRIIHSAAFRRLCYKTQVFITTEGDLFRTRLTHSLEVAQIGRAIARSLRANEDLVEAIALAHDLGHTPFGHAGQHALNQCMRPYGGFEHNVQSLRVVDLLEQRYGQFEGLNLSFETREGILKHCSKANAKALGPIGARFLDGTSPSLEAQICNLADEIAYCNHDIDDGLRSGLITLDQIRRVPIFADRLRRVKLEQANLSDSLCVAQAIRDLIGDMVADLVNHTNAQLRLHRPRSVARVRSLPGLVEFSPAMRAELQALKRFLFRQLYRHPQVVLEMDRGQQILSRLFERLQQYPELLPPEHQQRYKELGPRALADYIAGMTDRFAIKMGTGSI